MNQPLYIAPDEEIISVIARLRSLPESEVTLVFPKHSVVTQSIINLKLLAREGEKLQKRLTLVSQNENARSLAEKIGFATLPYTQEMEKGNLYLQGERQTEAPAPKPAVVEPDPYDDSEQFVEVPAPLPQTRNIGSQNFYQGGTGMPAPESVDPAHTMRIQTPPQPVMPPQAPQGTSLRVRNMTPERPPSLNSVRYQETVAQDISRQSTVSTPIFPDTRQTPPQPSAPAPQPATSFTTPAATPPTAISDFFNRKEAAQKASVPMPVAAPVRPSAPGPAQMPKVPLFSKKSDIPKKAVPTQPVMVASTVSNKLTTALISLVVLLILASGALGFFVVFPSATVTVNPQTVSDSYDQSFTINADTGSSEVPLTKTTEELTVNIAGIASGAANTPANSGSRATGTIKISNTYSSDSQTLVATTRFESSTGKIYRIQESVSVPGNGSVEATVIADGSGDSYNLSEGTLTVPGFKGSDKYEKFSATVTKAIGGGDGTETTSSGTFIRADEETLRTRATEEAKRVFSEQVNNEEGDAYTFTDGLKIERVTEGNMPKVGSVPGEYEYSAVFKVTAFATSKEVVTRSVMKNIRTEYDDIEFVPTTQELSFADFTLNDQATEASVKVHLDTNLAARLDTSKIKADLAGKSATELENFTTAHPEVKGLSISFNPSWALKRIPKNPDKIQIVTE